MDLIATPDGIARCGGSVWRCALGRGGVRADKREGDGASPAGAWPIRRVLYRADREHRPETGVDTSPITTLDGWCDDPADPAYNTRIRLPYPARSEALWRDDHVYDLVVVLGYNDAPVVSGRGSAIFMHVARPDYTPTEGCVALAAADLRAFLAMADPASRVVILER